MQTDHSSRWTSALALVLYAMFVVYQSLADGGSWACTGPLLGWPRRASRSDVLANVIAYVPLGLLFVWAATRRWAPGASSTLSSSRILSTAIIGVGATALLSLSMEVIQACQARRVSSALDLAANVSGGAFGVVAAVALRTLTRRPHTRVTGGLATQEGRLRLLTALVVAVWVVSQTMPWVFAVDVGTIRSNLSFLKRIAEHGVTFDAWRWLRHAGAWVAVACACRLVGRQGGRAVLLLAASGAVSLGLQLLLHTRGPLSFEELTGMGTAALAVPVLMRVDDQPRPRAWALGLLLGASLAIAAYELRPEAGAAIQSFSWWPRVGLGGLLGALDYALFFGWYGMTAVVAAQWANAEGDRRARWMWPLAAVITTLGLEVLQTSVPGRGPDFSAPMFTLLGVLLTTTVLVDGARSTS